MPEGAQPNPEPGPAPYRYRRGDFCTCARCRCRGLMAPLVLITIGGIFLVDQFLPRWGFEELWPLILIVIGLIKLAETAASTEGHRG